jgi:hypothetical protein
MFFLQLNLLNDFNNLTFVHEMVNNEVPTNGFFDFKTLTNTLIPIKIFKTMDENQNQLNIELTEDIAEGIYSNLAVISHSPTEFVIDFIRMMPNVPKAKVKSRIILTPHHAKRLLSALQDNINKFEALHGSISDNNTPPFPMNFNTPKAQA